MTITSEIGEELNFFETGVDGIYVLDRVAFKGRFDEGGNNDWEKSSGKKKLQEWAENNLSEKILKRFDVDIPTVEEVFSQKMFNYYKKWSGKLSNNLISEQFPIFKDSDERMKEFSGIFTCWWTRSAYANCDDSVWHVDTDGSMYTTYAGNMFGFVPVLRKKTRPSKTKKIKDLTMGEYTAICKTSGECSMCPLIYTCKSLPCNITDKTLNTEVEVPEE